MINYIAIRLADNFTIPESYGNQNCVSRDGAYKIIDKNDGTTAEDIGYTSGESRTELYGVGIEDWPNLTHEEAKALTGTVGDSGAAWSAPVGGP